MDEHMKFGEIWDKFELYIMSLWFLFFLIIVITVDIPMCFGDSCQFIGFWEVIKKNTVPVVSLLLVLFGVIFLEMQENPEERRTKIRKIRKSQKSKFDYDPNAI